MKFSIQHSLIDLIQFTAFYFHVSFHKKRLPFTAVLVCLCYFFYVFPVSCISFFVCYFFFLFFFFDSFVHAENQRKNLPKFSAQ